MKIVPSISDLIRSCSIALLMVVICAMFSEMNRYFELLSHFQNQYLYCAILLLAASALMKHILGASLASISLLVSSFSVLPLYLDYEHSQVTDHSTEIKVLLSNVYTSNTQYQKLTDFVLQEEPDIVVLQEVNENWINNIKLLFEHYPHRIIKAQHDNFGIAVFSKLETLEQKIVDLSEIEIPSIESIFKVGDKIVYLLATHPLPPVSPETYRFRNSQLKRVATRLSEIDTAKLLVGDLNITPWSADYTILESETGLRNIREGFGVLPTWPASIPFLMIPIDHMLVSNEFGVTKAATGPNIGSDHLPVVATLQLHHAQPKSAVQQPESSTP